MAEMGLLALMAVPGQHVMYAGIALGIHRPFLAQLAPSLAFHLSDPTLVPFAACKNIVIQTPLFSDATTRRWNESNTLFL